MMADEKVISDSGWLVRTDSRGAKKWRRDVHIRTGSDTSIRVVCTHETNVIMHIVSARVLLHTRGADSGYEFTRWFRGRGAALRARTWCNWHIEYPPALCMHYPVESISEFSENLDEFTLPEV